MIKSWYKIQNQGCQTMNNLNRTDNNDIKDTPKTKANKTAIEIIASLYHVKPEEVTPEFLSRKFHARRDNINDKRLHNKRRFLGFI